LPTCVIWSNPVDVWNGDKAMGRSLAAIMPHDGGIRPAGAGVWFLTLTALSSGSLALRPAPWWRWGWVGVGWCVMDGIWMLWRSSAHQDAIIPVCTRPECCVPYPRAQGFLSPRKVLFSAAVQSRNYVHTHVFLNATVYVWGGLGRQAQPFLLPIHTEVKYTKI
jgi:hypothetical protein